MIIFKVLNFNVRSLSKNFNKLQLFLDSLKCDFNVLVLTETWLTDDNKNLFSFPGYEGYYFIRHGKRGGGVSIFLKDKYTCVYFDITVDNDSKS